MGLWVPKLRAEYIIEGALYQEALDYAESAQYDLILLDIMLPKVDGLSVLRRLRQ